MASQKLALLQGTITISMTCSIVLSWKLWLSSRLFPLAPVATFLPKIPFPVDVVWASALVGLLVSIAVFPRQGMLIFAFLGLAGLLTLWDQTRWQPWFYQYFFMLATIAHCGWGEGKMQRQRMALNTCRSIIIFTYVWSGLQKLNASFIQEAWPDLAGPLLGMIFGTARRIPTWLILVVPVMAIKKGLSL